jgi:hypothetical protein
MSTFIIVVMQLHNVKKNALANMMRSKALPCRMVVESRCKPLLLASTKCDLNLFVGKKEGVA